MTETPGTAHVMGDEEAKAHLAALVDSSDDAIVSRSPEGIITSWNKAAEKLYGYTAEEAIGRHISMLVPADRIAELQQLAERIQRGERVKNLQTMRISKEGREIQVSLTLSPILGDNGLLTGISVIARDISEQIHMERLLRESETRYRVLVEMAPDAVFVHQDGFFVYANCPALGIHGVKSLEQLQQHQLFDLVHQDDREAVRASISQLMEGGKQISVLEYRLLRQDGQELCIDSSSTLIQYQGRPSIQVIARDVSERRQDEREREVMLKELDFQRTRFETVVRQLPVGVLIAESPSGKLVYQNEISCEIFRKEVGELNGSAECQCWQLYRLDGSPLPTGEHPLLRAVRGESVIGEEFSIRRGDGTQRYISLNATPIRGVSGEVVSGLAAFSDITEGKGAAKALSESEERLKLALDAAGMGSWDISVQTGQGLWSKRHFLLLGYPEPEEEAAPASTGMWQDRIHPDDLEQVLAALDQARADQALFRSEHRVIRVDNQQMIWVNVMGRFICDQARAACRFIGVIFDVSERKASEDALRRSIRRFRLMADSMPQMVWTAEADGSVDYTNAHFESYTGLDREGLEERGRSPEKIIQDVIHPHDAEETTRVWLHALRTGEPYQHEMRIRSRDGAYRWHLSRANAERDEQGTVVKWYGTATDIHELREMQERLRASETRFRWLYESNLIAIFFWRKDGKITDANQAYCDLVGISAVDCRKGDLNWLEVTSPEYYQRDLAAIEEIMTRGICKSYEKVIINLSSGDRIAVLTAIAKMVDAQSEGIGFAVDLTDLKRTEQALKTSEATLKLAIETTGLGIFDLDLVSGKGEWDEIAKRHYGFQPEAEVSLDRVMQAVHPEDRPHMEQIARDAATYGGAGVYSAEYRTLGEDGKLRWLSMHGQVSYDEEGKPVRLVGACLNITDIVQSQEALKEEMSERLRAVEELRKQEQLLIRQGRLAAMGEMIANIAHQWRQPLNTLGLIVQEIPTYYERNLLSTEYLEASVSRAMQVINYMSQTIDGFRNFFGPDKEKQSFLAGEVLERTVAILDAAFAELKMELEVIADREVVVYGSPNEYSQVILNILINAKDALLERKVAQPKVAVRLFREQGRAVLTITDNAGGIPAGIMDRIFDPYFTTKGPDKGTGIGLFMSKTIIEKSMNGTLTVRNTDQGAQFRIEV